MSIEYIGNKRYYNDTFGLFERSGSNVIWREDFPLFLFEGVTT